MTLTDGALQERRLHDGIVYIEDEIKAMHADSAAVREHVHSLILSRKHVASHRKQCMSHTCTDSKCEKGLQHDAERVLTGLTRE